MNTLLIKNGFILTQDGNQTELQGDILIKDGVIQKIAPVISHDGTVIDAKGKAVLPGFVDTHRHTWQTALRAMAAGDNLRGYQTKIQGRFGRRFSPADVYAGTLLGAYSAGQSGITTLCDESHVQNSPDHTDAAVKALHDSGIRAVFDYGWPSIDAEKWLRNSTLEHPKYIQDLQKKAIWKENPLLSLQMMLRGPKMTSVEMTARDIGYARSLGLRSTMHVSGGSVALLHEAKLLGPDITLIHCCTCSDDELAMIKQSGAAVSSSPNLELNMLGLGAPPIRRFLAAGLQPSLSIDVETSVSGDMFTAMRAALLSQTAEALYRPEENELPAFSPRDVLRFATIEGARACGLGNSVGSLEVGKQADLILINMDDINLAPVQDEYIPDVIVAAAHPGNVDTVIVNGKLIRQSGRDCDHSLRQKAIVLAHESRTRLIKAHEAETASAE